MEKTGLPLMSIPQELLYGFLNNKYDSIILIDKEGTIKFISDYNKTITDGNISSYIGRNLKDLSSESKLMETVKSGKPEVTLFRLADNRECIVTRIPIHYNDKIVGAIGRFMFSSFEQLEKQRNKILKIIEERVPSKNDVTKYANPLSTIRYTLNSILGNSQKIKEAKSFAMKIAQFSEPILITGETGTGKELFAQAIHDMSPRKNNAFIKVNCAAVPNELIESELFGYMPGSFTGASRKGKTGKFEKADKGTIFLDEIGDMPFQLQAKVLRALQEMEIEPIGSDRPIWLDFRLISATNKNLQQLVQKELFRKDLYHRINTISLQLPPLRQRPDDIPILLSHFINKVCQTNNVDMKSIDSEVYNALKTYPWHGNVRELQSVAVQLLVKSGPNDIHLTDLPPTFIASPSNSNHDVLSSPDNLMSLKKTVEKTEKKMIIKTLHETGNNKKKAAQILKIQRSQLYERIKRYNIKIDSDID